KVEITKENIIEKLGEFQEKIANLQEARRQKLEVHNNIKSRLEATLSEVSFPWQQEPEARLLLLEDLKATSEAKLKKFKKELQIDLENLSGERQQLRQRLEVSRKAQMEWVQLEQLSAELVRLRTESADIVLQKKELPSLKEKLQLQVEASRQKLENLQLKREN